MSIKISLLALALAFGLAACGNTIPNSELSSSDRTFPQDSPEFFQNAVGDRVLFAVDQATLSPEATSILDAQAAWLMQNGQFAVLVEGHADEQGTREYNLALGARRANAVQEYLISRGVSQGRLSVITYGKERPLEICSTEECWSKNRRAVSVVSLSGNS